MTIVIIQKVDKVDKQYMIFNENLLKYLLVINRGKLQILYLYKVINTVYLNINLSRPRKHLIKFLSPHKKWFSKAKKITHAKKKFLYLVQEL